MTARAQSAPAEPSGSRPDALPTLGFVDPTAPAALEHVMAGQDRYRLLAENSSDVVYLTDLSGIIAWVSPSVAHVLGFDAESLIGRRALDLVDPRDLQAVQATRPEVYSGVTVSEVLTRFVTTQGRFRWMSVRATPLRSDGDEVVGAVVALRDVDDLVRSREAAESARERLQATLDAMLDPHVHLEALRDESGAIVDFAYTEANPAACAYNGMTRDELLGARLLVLLPGHVGAGLFARFCDVVETGRALSLDAFAYPVDRGGEWSYADVRGVRVGDGLSYTWRDVTSQFQDRRRLAESERQFRLLAENASDIVWHIASDGRVIWVSESVHAILGWRPEELVGTIGVELAHPEDLDRARAARDAVIAGGVVNDEFRFMCADGSWRWVELAERLLPDALGSGRVVAMHDIHEAVAARTELEHVIRHDGLTGLGNRSRIHQRIVEALERPGGRTAGLAVLCVGVDSLGAINAAFTHNAGDLVLATLARRVARHRRRRRPPRARDGRRVRRRGP